MIDDDMEPPPAWLIEEWNLFQTARWMGVAPWELAEQPGYWYERGKALMMVEQGVMRSSEKSG